MFKKFKDKIAEEMKQSPARLQASMQQLAQAVVSPAPSDSSIQELSASNDNFSLIDEREETPRNSPIKQGFQDVNLITHPSNSVAITRKSSENSVVSDISSLFPIYESTTNLYHLQSDVDQSASEIDDNISVQLDKVTKEQLYSAYYKIQSKYRKYRERYTSLTSHYRELEKAKTKLESVLEETQDKVLRRVADLKEQCQLEQQAKAHLEEVLRNDIEEKDHIINTLYTKIKLLQSSGRDSEDVSSLDISNRKENSKNDLIDFVDEPVVATVDESASSAEKEQLKEKLKKLENLVLKYKDSLKRNKAKCLELIEEKNVLENNYVSLKSSSDESLRLLTEELEEARTNVIALEERVSALKKREEESVISLAENKLSIHRELDCKEEQIKQLQRDLKQALESRDSLNEIVNKYKIEAEATKTSFNDNGNFDMDDNIRHASGNVEQESQENAARLEKDVDTKNTTGDGEEGSLRTNLNRDKWINEKLVESKAKLNELETLCEDYRVEKEKLRNELSNLRTAYEDLKNEKDALKIVTVEKRKETEATVENLQATVNNLDKELENMRNALEERDRVCVWYNAKVQEYSTLLEKSKENLLAKDMEIKNLRVKIDEELNEELEKKNTELIALRDELESCRITISDFSEKFAVKEATIDSLNAKRKRVIDNAKNLKSTLRELKENHGKLKEIAQEKLLNQNDALSTLIHTMNISFSKFSEENVHLKSEIKNYETKLQNYEELKTNRDELEKQLANATELRCSLEAKLKEYDRRSTEAVSKAEEHEKLSHKYHELIAKLDYLKLKVFDAENTQHRSEEVKSLISDLKEQLKTFDDNAESSKEDLPENSPEKLIRAVRNECNELQNSISVLTSEIASLKNEIVEKDGTIRSLNDKLIEESQQVATFETSLRELTETNKTQQETIRTKNLQLKKLKAVKDNQADTIRDVTEETRKLKSENTEILERLQNSVEEINHLKEENKAIRNTIEELKKFEVENAEISKKLQNSIKEIDSLRTENDQLRDLGIELQKLTTLTDELTSENKALKNKENVLLKVNTELEEALKENNAERERKEGEYMSNLERLRKESESYKSQFIEQQDRMRDIDERLHQMIAEIETKNKMLEEQNEKMIAQEKSLQEAQANLQKRNDEYEKILRDLDEALSETERARNCNVSLTTDLEASKARNEQLGVMANENAALKSKLNNLTERIAELENVKVENSKLEAERNSFETEMNILKNVSQEKLKLEADLDSLRSRVLELEATERENTELKTNIADLRATKEKAIENLTNELSELKNTLEEKIAELNLLDAKNGTLLQELEKSKFSTSRSIEEKIEEVETLKNTVKELENDRSELRAKETSLNEEMSTLRKELEDMENRNKTNEDLVKTNNKLQEENKKLEAQLDEVLITFQAKESQMQIVNDELKSRTDRLKEELKANEEEQTMRLKQLVKEFQAQLQDKEEELQAALEKRFDYQQSRGSDLIQQYKEQLEDLQAELIAKSEQVENLLLKNKDMSDMNDEKVGSLLKTIEKMKRDHADEIKEIEKKWKAIFQQRTEKLEMKHEEEINELAKEWHNERRLHSQIDTNTEELESTSRVAMAAVQSNTDSFHTLQQTLVSQKRELAELRKLVKLRNESLEDSTEIEYLRNILFEYMMGRETMVLAKVIAAVVKFDQQQTNKILKKEEDKLTLLGSLGLV